MAKYQSLQTVQRRLATIRRQNVNRHYRHAAALKLREDILRAQHFHTLRSEHDRLEGARIQGPLGPHALVRLAEIKNLLSS